MCIIVALEKFGLSSRITCASTVTDVSKHMLHAGTATWCISDFKEPIVLKGIHIHGGIIEGRKYLYTGMHHFYLLNQNTHTQKKSKHCEMCLLLIWKINNDFFKD